MHSLPTTALLALPLLLSACFGRSVEPVAIRPPLPDTALTALCESPVALPDTPDAVRVSHWAADRAALVTCRDRHAALVGWALNVSAEGPQ